MANHLNASRLAKQPPATLGRRTVVASAWAGHLCSQGVAVQGNGLVGEAVLDAMLQTFASTEGSLAHRVLAALEAGDRSGGQAAGVMSAAMLVRTSEGFPFDIDLRVDAHGAPAKELRFLFDLHQARQMMIDAKRIAAAEPGEARERLSTALQLGGSWDRVLRIGARVAEALGDDSLANDLRTRAKAVDPDTLSNPEPKP